MDHDIDQLAAILRSIIAKELEVSVDSVQEAASFRSELGLDSVAAINIIFAIETFLKVDLNPSDFVGIDSLADLRAFLQSDFLVRRP